MKLGLVTYNMAKDWDIPTIIENCCRDRISRCGIADNACTRR